MLCGSHAGAFISCMQPASFTLAVAACTHQLARACVMPRSAAVASRSGGFVSCSTLAVAGCRRQIASTCVMLHVAAVTHAHALKLSPPSRLHTCSRSVHASARSCVRDAALCRCGFARWCSRLMQHSARLRSLVQAADCCHVRDAPRRLVAYVLVLSFRVCSQPASR